MRLSQAKRWNEPFRIPARFLAYGSALVLQLQSFSASLTLAWDNNPNPTVVGTEIHYGTPAGTYDTVIDVGTASNLTLVHLEDNKRYSFYAVHYDVSGRISDPSNAIEHPNAPPSAFNDFARVHRNRILTLVASDPPFNKLTYSIPSRPSHGTLAGKPPDLVYYPDTGFLGNDSFTFTASDGQFETEPATVTLEVYNTPPEVTGFSITVARDTSADLWLPDVDADSDSLILSVIQPPAHGILSGTPPGMTYTPNPGYVGPDQFTFKGNDGYADSPPATINFVVRSNQRPKADAQTLSATNGPLEIHLSGSDGDGDSLSFLIAGPPSQGELMGEPPDFVYEPRPGYTGSDSFSFVVHDGLAASEPATIQLNVVRIYQSPVAKSQTRTNIVGGTPMEITLEARDPDDDPLTFSLLNAPAHGTLEGTPPDLIYTSVPEFAGFDTFTFMVNDGYTDSAPATVTIRVNQAPIAYEQTLVVTNGATPVTMTGSDSDGDVFSFDITEFPAYGTISGAPPNVIYTPARRYSGPDRFRFEVFDGMVGSQPATVTLNVTRVHQAPIVQSQTVSVTNGPLSIVLTATDPDGDPITFALVDPPEHGAISGNLPNVIYTPAALYSGFDRFTFRATDGFLESTNAAIQLEIQAANLAPRVTVGPDKIVTLPLPALLHGSIEDDRFPGTLPDPTLNWNVVSGPGPVVFSQPASLETRAEFLEPGMYILRLTANDGRLDGHGTLTVSVGQLPKISPGSPLTLLIEAESGTVTPPMQVAQDPTITNRVLNYVGTTTRDAGQAELFITVPLENNHFVWCRVKPADPGSDSCFVTVDSHPVSEDIFDMAADGKYGAWRWVAVSGRGGSGLGDDFASSINPRIFHFTPGQHSLTFRGRDPNAHLDSVIITSDPSFDPTAAENSMEPPKLLVWTNPFESELGWMALPGRRYRLDATESPATGPWEALSGEYESPAAAPYWISFPASNSPRRFYRLVLLPY